MLIVYILIMTAVTCAVFGVAALLERTKVTVAAPAPSSVRRSGSPFEQWLARGFSRHFVSGKELEREKLRIWLLQAGFDSPDACESYWGYRLLLALGLPVFVLLTVPLFVAVRAEILMLTILVAVAIGFIAPMRYVSSQRAKCQQIVREGLPDVLDLLLVCSQTGLGIDTAILRVGEEIGDTHPILAKYLRQISSALRAGRSRADALRGFAERTGIDETKSLVNLLVQSDSLGTSMVTSLKVFSDEMRELRLLKAEEIGQKVTVKLTMVLASCFIPAILISIVAPVIGNAMRSLGGR